MANCVITSDNRLVKFELNDEFAKISTDTLWLKKADLKHVSLSIDNSVKINRDGRVFYLTVDGVGNTVLVDTVDGQVPSDNQDLADKIANIIGGV